MDDVHNLQAETLVLSIFY